MSPQPANSNPVDQLRARFADAIVRAYPEQFDDPSTVDPLIAPAKNPEHGDFQSNAAMGLAKRVKRKPIDVAKAIIEHAEIGDIAEPLSEASIAGPGFINVRLRSDALAAMLEAIDTPALGIPAPNTPETVVVDLCGVNLAKQMHVGHLRATVVGDAIARTLEALGHTVVRQNHVGDWGLPIAMVTDALMREAAAGTVSLDDLTLDTLDALYRRAQADCKADTRGLDAARTRCVGWDHPKALAELETQVEFAQQRLAQAKSTLVRLQSGDAEVVAVWQRIYDVTMAACLDTCRRLHATVTAEATAGESTYRDELAGVVDDLVSRGVAKEDDGALIVENADEKNKPFEPTLIRKSDGGFLYATTDLAGIRRRVQTLGADRAAYAVDARQALHFKQVFASAHKAGYTSKPDGTRARLQHAAFGMVLGEDGRPFKTRSGENVRLASLIDEAVDRATALVEERSADLAEADRKRVAEAVAIAAVKYADLSSERSKDYVFSFDRMVSFQGNTGPYLLYALTRIKSMFKKAGLADPTVEPESAPSTETPAGPFAIEAPEEKTLALLLLDYAPMLAGVGESLEPHRTCQYLYDLAGAFSRFYERCPVLKAEGATRDSRLRLASLTARTLRHGLDTLGIGAVDRM
ncbi:MAG: arginine--tRNA ligase [Planctomycetota bacterium]